jgi:hypothetical protein
MSGQHKGSKRARTQGQDGNGAPANQSGVVDDSPGRDQLLLTSPDLQTRLGRKFIDDTELLPLLLAHGLIRRVRTIQIQVRPLGGDSFKITLDASQPTVGEAKAGVRAPGLRMPKGISVVPRRLLKNKAHCHGVCLKTRRTAARVLVSRRAR